ncbi:hypothetical protein SynBIOSE41_04460 [Synechococcus sp. BIOS-E4-1]|uniref:hypothetical protein n=1 Tax=Synechococcus sp. BIOS-E4-1 TaxID=1400864 RepID=UPI001645FA7A|nr:hypothetical protein [Synechococcus sp. BIOS-E4-1]QNI56909.1 hypothetical protein SynBIOSE41_04460 [Synechococcus sp. BIOS-E4-1]
MQPPDANHQAPLPLWDPSPEPVQADPYQEDDNDALRARIVELEQMVEHYEALLSELPDLFERKFQQRLEPLMERYRLLARAQQILGEPALPLIEEPSKPLPEIPIPLLERWRSTRHNNRRRADRHAA